MKIMKFYFAAVLILVCFGGFVSQGFAQSTFYTTAKEEGKVVLYTTLAASDNKPFLAAFAQAYPGVKLEIYRASGTTILQKILTESRAAPISPMWSWLKAPHCTP